MDFLFVQQVSILTGALKTREWTTRHEMTRVDKAGVETVGLSIVYTVLISYY